jgi:hypothetical protein
MTPTRRGGQRLELADAPVGLAPLAMWQAGCPLASHGTA